MTVAFNSGGGMRSSTPSLSSSPRLNKLANSTARCCSSSSGLVVYLARVSAMRSCSAGEVLRREEIFVTAASTNCCVRKLAYGESMIEISRSTMSLSLVCRRAV